MIRIDVSTSGQTREGVTVTVKRGGDVSKGVIACLLLVSAVRHPRDGRCIIIRRAP